MNFGNIGNMWCYWMNFGGIEVMKDLLYRLGWIHLWCMWEILFHEHGKILWVWVWKIFVGMENFFVDMEKFCGSMVWKKICGYGYGQKFVLAWNFGHWKFLLGMRFSLVILMMSNTCLCWFFRRVEWQWLIPLEDLWRKGSFSYGANFASFCISEIHR